MKFAHTNVVLAGLAAAQVATAAASCPTITTTERCTTCAIPECALLATVTVPCGCPYSVPVQTISEKCGAATACDGGCALTEYSTVHQSPCTSNSCPTVTSTVTSAHCTPTASGGGICAEPDCELAVTEVIPCSCIYNLPVPTVTVTGACTCRTGCLTTTEFLYPPCPYSPPPSSTTTTLRTVVTDPPVTATPA